ncbi:MAG TPA: TlpA disulfide reductase family protein [Pyrinomonadaceae bacterium]|jgi:thiol-disulfide isomerase/thioredoxin|nr:TlpA disulfide reductase family protein [Pyrinomonadaceae bacterium]
MSQVRRKFWTRGRAALTGVAFAAAALAASSCKSNDTANRQNPPQNQPKVTITTQSGSKQAQPPQQQPAGPQQAPQLEVLPADILNQEIQAVDGKAFRLADFNDKVVVLDLWATWCGPCRLEIPHLVEMNDDYKGKGVEIIGLTTENPETDAELVRDFAKEFKINYRLGWATADLARPIMRGSNSIPQTLVIAPGGRVLNRFRGFSPQLAGMIRSAVDKARETTGD